MKLYHGIYTYFEKIDLNNSLDKRDFGMGFYTTTNFKQATKWALKIGKRNRTRGKSNFISYL
ncbi:DUF3990 domain-containing protein [Clostridium sp. ZBS2]|uniref:DUF3990 domain-containing protein n=1 Tax=Clostridium sp. ZBS2 TaxID=2949976 RepID=UPI0020799B9D|nr:DUF3990 domain-containing protein [Clostridium sp. ZBS2]